MILYNITDGIGIKFLNSGNCSLIAENALIRTSEVRNENRYVDMLFHTHTFIPNRLSATLAACISASLFFLARP